MGGTFFDNKRLTQYHLKKVIAAMTVGKDVGDLFPDVVKCVRTSNLELKKLVYLYIMNYAKTQPETAILSVNAFVHVSTRFCFLFIFTVELLFNFFFGGGG